MFEARKIILCVLGVVCIQTLLADIPFRKYTVDDGLSHNSVWAILQDHRGFMWFGTKDGLNCYDGYNTRSYRKGDNSPNALGNNFIRCLYEFPEENEIWVGTDQGLFIYDMLQESFRPFRVQTTDSIMIHDAISSIASDKKGNIWISAFKKGIFKYHRDSQTLVLYTKGLDDLDTSPRTILTRHTWRIKVDHNDEVWTSTFRSGICKYSSAEDRFVYIPTDYPGFRTHNNEVYAIHTDSLENSLWVGTFTGGLLRYDCKKNLWKQYINNSSDEVIVKIHSIIDYSHSELLLGADNGLYLFNKNNFTFKRLDMQNGYSSMSNQSIFSICRDTEKGIWIGTYFGGVNYMQPNHEAIKSFHTSSDVRSEGNVISCFAPAASGKMWIGTNDQGLSLFDENTAHFISYSKYLSYTNVTSVTEDNEHVWVGFFTEGLDRINIKRPEKKKNYRNITNDSTSLSHNSVYCIFRSPSGKIYIGTQLGLDLYNSETDAFIRLPWLRNLCVYDIHEDDQGLLWVTTYEQGIFCYNPGNEQYINYVHHENDSTSISENRTLCLHIDRKRNIWIGTEGSGLNCFDPATRTFTAITVKEGLPSDVICSMEEDFSGHLWIGTNSALVRLNPDTREIKNFYKNNGLQGNQYNYNASIRDKQGRLWFGGVDGFNIIVPELMYDNRFIPPVFITGIQVFNKPLKPDMVNNPLGQSIHSTDVIELTHKQSTIGIDFIALSYISPTHNQYMYYLEGFETHWNNIGNHKHATYTNLSPGEYVFHVKGSNNDGVWNNDVTRIKFIIHPPFWKRTSMFFLYTLIILGIGALIIRYIRRSVSRKHQNELLVYKMEKDQELYDSKITFFTNIVHEIRTPLSLIKAPLESVISTNGDLLIKDKLLVMEKNVDRLQLLVNQLLDFRKIGKNEYIFNFSSNNLCSIIENVCYRFRPSCELKNIKLIISLPKEPVICSFDPEAITKMISNLLGNALKYTNDEIHITLETHNNTTLFIRVTNNGEYIPAKYHQKIFDPFYQIEEGTLKQRTNGTGIGLSLVKHIAERHGGHVIVDSEPQGDTTFIVEIPLVMDTADAVDQLSLSILDDYSDEKSADYSPDEDMTQKSVVLIVEDNIELLNFMYDDLSAYYAVMKATNGKEALDKLAGKQIIDLIITDIIMPEIDGLELCKIIRSDQLYCHIPIILLTAQTDISSKTTGLEYGVDVYIEKPFSMEFIRSQIKSLLRNRDKLKEMFSHSPFVSPQSIARNSADLKFMNKVNEIIENNLSETNNLIDTIADKMFLSRSSIHKKIKSISGMPPNEYIQLVRLKKAAELLRSGEYKINEIACIVGFNTPSYFAKCFYNQFGILPRDFNGFSK